MYPSIVCCDVWIIYIDCKVFFYSGLIDRSLNVTVHLIRSHFRNASNSVPSTRDTFTIFHIQKHIELKCVSFMLYTFHDPYSRTQIQSTTNENLLYTHNRPDKLVLTINWQRINAMIERYTWNLNKTRIQKKSKNLWLMNFLQSFGFIYFYGTILFDSIRSMCDASNNNSLKITNSVSGCFHRHNPVCCDLWAVDALTQSDILFSILVSWEFIL